LWNRVSAVDHENASKKADKPSLIHLIVTATLPVSILKRLAAFGCHSRAKIDFSVYFAHLFHMRAKNVAMALPALPLLLNETKTVHSSSFARFILLIARLLQLLFWLAVEQLIVMFW
jgi:hypothetical protein